MSAQQFIARCIKGLADRSGLLLVWLPVAIFGIYIKDQLLTPAAWELLYAVLRPEVPPFTVPFTLLERFSLYAEGIVVGFLLVPMLLMVLLVFLPQRWWSWVVAIISIGVSLLLFFQLQTWKNTAHFMPWFMISDAIYWGAQHPESVSEYVSNGAILKLSALLLTIVALAIYQHRAGPRSWRQKSWLDRAGVMVVAVMAVGGLMAATAEASSPLRYTWYHRAALLEALRALELGRARSPVAISRSAPELQREYERLSGWQPDGRDARYFGRAAGYDVIVYILETAPARHDSLDNLDDLPALRGLASSSWVGNAHYSTYPYTSMATFSILTSLYPPDLSVTFGNERRQAPGLAHVLSDLGYHASYYVPHRFENPREDAMYGALGFDRIVVSDPAIRGATSGQPYYKRMILRDRQALERLKTDALELIGKDQRYLAVFSPQIGHAPWPDVVSEGQENSRAMRARNLLRLQDQWIGEIVEMLRQAGRLDRTLIVVTGDHGIRTNKEDPDFSPRGALVDYSFHVPLLVYAPGVLQAPATLDYRTSHIDITPTVLSLLGVSHGRDFEQGMPVWDTRARDRTLFFWAYDYFGAIGYCRQDQCGIWNPTLDLMFAGHTLNDRALHPVLPDTPEGQQTQATMEAMQWLNEGYWLSGIPPL